MYVFSVNYNALSNLTSTYRNEALVWFLSILGREAVNILLVKFWCIVFFFFLIFIYLFIYSASVGLSCIMQTLSCGIWNLVL